MAEKLEPCMCVLKAAENRKSQKTCGNRKIKKNVAENRKKQFFLRKAGKGPPITHPLITTHLYVNVCSSMEFSHFNLGLYLFNKLIYL